MQHRKAVKKGRSGPRVIDLFAGAGLFGHSFETSGFSVVASYEIDATACLSLAANTRGEVIRGDLAKLRPEGECDVLIGGPPCQGFSSIGKKNGDDPRNSLAAVMGRWARTTGAKWVVVENVPAFTKSPAWQKLDRDLGKLGFVGQVFTLNARDYGAAQNRVRAITVYNRLGKTIRISAGNKHKTIRDSWTGLENEVRKDPLHFALAPSAFALERIRLIPEGGDVRDLFRQAPHLVAPSWARTKGKVVDIWGRLEWDGISNTIRTGFLHPSRGRFLHPTEDRPITFREAARLQTIPDSYKLHGGPQALARQIGNAVPMAIGRATASAIARCL